MHIRSFESIQSGGEHTFAEVVDACLQGVVGPGRSAGRGPRAVRGVGPGRRPGGGSLDIRGVSFPERGNRPVEGGISEEEQAHDRARWRRALQRVAARALPREAVATCGRYAGSDPGYTVGEQRYVAVKRGAHGAFFGNVVQCGSVWHCPVCSAKLAQERRREVAAVIAAHRAAGGEVVMMTLTSKHSRSDDVKRLREEMAKRWQDIRGGRRAKVEDAAHGVIGGVRALEITHGDAGWHPHFHLLLFFSPTSADGVKWENIRDYCEAKVSRWLELSARDGNAAERHAQHWEVSQTAEQAGEYATKWGPDWEMTHSHLKKGRRGGRSPWQILIDIHDHNRSEDIALFQQYALAFKGAKQLNWFGSVRHAYGVETETDGELIAKEEPAEAVGYIADATFREVAKRGLQLELLRAVEASGYLGLLAFIGGYGFGLGGVRPGDWRQLCEAEISSRRISAGAARRARRFTKAEGEARP